MSNRQMFDFGVVGTIHHKAPPSELPCERELIWPDEGWSCINDHTGCIFNDGHNTCTHAGNSLEPLED